MDYMRPDIVALLRGSDSSYVRELIGMEPVAVFRWAVLRAAVRAVAVLREAARLRAERREEAAGRPRGHPPGFAATRRVPRLQCSLLPSHMSDLGRPAPPTVLPRSPSPEPPPVSSRSATLLSVSPSVFSLFELWVSQ